MGEEAGPDTQRQLHYTWHATRPGNHARGGIRGFFFVSMEILHQNQPTESLKELRATRTDITANATGYITETNKNTLPSRKFFYLWDLYTYFQGSFIYIPLLKQ
jgi:hypothetical protein